MRLRPVLLAALVSLLLPVAGAAQRRPPPLDVVIVMNAERLRLDATTLAAVKEVASAHRDEILRIQAEAKPIQDSLRAVYELDEPDEDEVLKLAEQMGLADVEVRKLQLRSAIRMRKLLSAQQRSELVRIQQELLEASRKPRPLPAPQPRAPMPPPPWPPPPDTEAPTP